MKRSSQLVAACITAMCLMGFMPVSGVTNEPFRCVKGDCQNGYGTFHYANGNRYIGEFKDGCPHGQGILYCANGNKYLGHWEKNWRQGEGRYVFNEGHEYLGQFHRNQFHGKGTMRYANGDSYEGAWAQNLPNGHGTYAFRSGDRYEGQFADGRFSGGGTMYYRDGSRFTGRWRSSKKHGPGTFYDAKGTPRHGEWADGRALNASGNFRTDEEVFIIENVEEEAPDVAGRHDAAPALVTAAPVRIWAVVVGIAAYEHLPSLRYTDDDAYLFYAFLKSPEGGALPDGQVKVLIDEAATRENVLAAMRNTLLKAGENDVVVFYFSGHGVEGAFIPADFDGYNYRLYHDEIRGILEQSKARHKIVLGDACHAGTLSATDKSDLLATRAPVNQMLERYYKAFENSTGGMALFLSSKGAEVSLEDAGLRSGVFSYFLIRGLKGEADADGDKIVTIEELFTFVRTKVRAYTAGAQTPVLKGNFDHKMPVGAVRK
mgnify:CR=1 FL=1